MNLKPIKTMLLGMMLMLFGGFILMDPTSTLRGIEFLLLIIGLLIGVFGLFQKD